MFLKRFTHFLKISKMLFAMQKGVLKFAFETHVHRVLLVLVGGFISKTCQYLSFGGGF